MPLDFLLRFLTLMPVCVHKRGAACTWNGGPQGNRHAVLLSLGYELEDQLDVLGLGAVGVLGDAHDRDVLRSLDSKL